MGQNTIFMLILDYTEPTEPGKQKLETGWWKIEFRNWNPYIGIQKLEAGGQNPETEAVIKFYFATIQVEAQNQTTETRNWKLESRNQKLEARIQKPESGNWKPESRHQKLETGSIIQKP